MEDAPPVVYVFHGEDDFGMRQAIAALRAKLGATGPADLNTTLLEGPHWSMDALWAATATVPLLAPRRLVVLIDGLAALNRPRARKQFVELLDRLPPQTALIIQESKALEPKHWLLRWARSAGSRAFLQEFRQPRGGEMARWIRERARAEGGEIAAPAAAWLANLSGTNTGHAAQEISKMLAYVNYARPIEIEDVQLLGAPLENEDVSQIFKLVDAIGERDGPRSQKLLHQLLRLRDPLSIFAMVVRQFRMLLVAKEASPGGAPAPRLGTVLRIPDFVARKVSAQSQNYERDELEQIFRELLSMDEQIKTGRVAAEIALAQLVARLTTR